MRRALLLFFLICLYFSAKAQNLTNLSATQQGNEVVVNYQLDGEKGKAYTVALYASNNNFASPLQLVQGDVGTKRILAGANKTITWRVLDELKNFDGDLSFEIRAVPAPPLFSKITSSATKVKRGSKITISWAGGFPQDQVVVELVKGDTHVPAGTITNKGSLLFEVPKKTKTGDYKILLSQAGEQTSSTGFVVQPKIPLLLKIGPAILVAGVAVAILLKPPEKQFPEPPNLTN